MGGGHVSRPDFGMPQPDAAYPLTEFYLLAQQALEKSGSFMLPALYAGLQAPARRIYREEAAGYLQLAAAPAEGLTRLLSPARMQLLYSSLQVQPDGTPAALLLTEECTRLTVAVQLLPPFVWEDPLPPLPDVPAAIEEIRRVVTVFRELRGGLTEDGRTAVKSPSGTLSTAEAISVVTGGLALAAHFGDGTLRSPDIAAGILGAVVKDPVSDQVVWAEYLEAVVRERDGWADFYRACREVNR